MKGPLIYYEIKDTYGTDLSSTKLAYELRQSVLDDLDLGFNDDEFMQIINKAPSTRPNRFTILEHLKLNENQIKNKINEFNSAIKSLDI